MVEGLTGGRWALISKVHHCMVDGVSGTDLMVHLLDPSRRAVPPIPDEAWLPAAEPSDAALDRRCRDRISCAHRPSRHAPRARCCGSREVPAPRCATSLDGVLALRTDLRPAPALSIEGAIGPHRRWAVARASLDELKAIRERARRNRQRCRPRGHHRRVPRSAPRTRRSRRRRRPALARTGLGARGRRPHPQQPGRRDDRRAADRDRRSSRTARPRSSSRWPRSRLRTRPRRPRR